MLPSQLLLFAVFSKYFYSLFDSIRFPIPEVSSPLVLYSSYLVLYTIHLYWNIVSSVRSRISRIHVYCPFRLLKYKHYGVKARTHYSVYSTVLQRMLLHYSCCLGTGFRFVLLILDGTDRYAVALFNERKNPLIAPA